MLPDQGYAWPRIRTDPALVFGTADSLRPAQAHRYWLRLTVRNRSHYPAARRLLVLPNLDNTLYYFDEDARAWCTRRAGVTVATNSQRVKGTLRLPGHATTTVYVRVNLGQATALPPAMGLHVQLEEATAAQQTDSFYRLA